MLRWCLLFCALCLSAVGHTAIIERTLLYPSGALKIRASLFVPEGAGPHPVLLFNHGGMSGLIDNSKRRCRELAARGYLVFASSYRGEDGSEGSIEVAAGEIDDVLAGLKFLKTNPLADASRVGLIGFSHGALISLQAAKRGVAFQAMVFAYGVADVYSWYAHLKASKQLGTDATTQRLYGSGPESRVSEFAARAGLSALAKIDSKLPILIVQGGKDVIVPQAQAQLLFKALRAAGRQSELRLFPHSTHGFLIRREALQGVEKRESDAAWAAIYQFLDLHLAVAGGL
jgi:dipeptidyl aminopeptidase/acylaminoacyl peptidase